MGGFKCQSSAKVNCQWITWTTVPTQLLCWFTAQSAGTNNGGGLSRLCVRFIDVWLRICSATDLPRRGRMGVSKSFRMRPKSLLPFVKRFQVQFAFLCIRGAARSHSKPPTSLARGCSDLALYEPMLCGLLLLRARLKPGLKHWASTLRCKC